MRVRVARQNIAELLLYVDDHAAHLANCASADDDSLTLIWLAGLSLLCMLLGLLTALSYSDLVKSWRGGVWRYRY